MIDKLPPRERQVFDAALMLGEATVSQIQEQLPESLSASAVRAMLVRLERKGFITHRSVEFRNLYAAKVPDKAARRSALSQLVRTFFNNDPASAASALLGMGEPIEAAQLDELERAIRKAREELGK